MDPFSELGTHTEGYGFVNRARDLHLGPGTLTRGQRASLRCMDFHFEPKTFIQILDFQWYQGSSLRAKDSHDDTCSNSHEKCSTIDGANKSINVYVSNPFGDAAPLNLKLKPTLTEGHWVLLTI